MQGYSSLAVRDGSLACQKTNPKSGSPERQLEAGATAESPTMQHLPYLRYSGGKVCISKTPKPPTHPAPHQKRVETKRKRTKQASERSQGQVRATTRTMLRDIFISLPYFFPSFHSHSTTIDDAKKKKSLKYDRNAPLRRPRSLDSTEAVLQIGGFFLKMFRGDF